MEVIPGYKQSDVGIIPEDWVVVSLSEIGDSLIGLTYQPSKVRKYGTLVLRSSNIQNGLLCFDNNVFVETKIPERIKVRPGDILICTRNGSRKLIGKSAIIDERATGMTFGAFMGVFRSDQGQYLRHMFKSDIFKKQINEHLGATINQITSKSLKSFKVPLPQKNQERIKIADVLNNVDELAVGLDQLIAKKRNLKQATMQQLLNGKIRLIGFKKKWLELQLKEITKPQKGQLITKNTIVDGDIPVIAGGQQPSCYHAQANRNGKTITISASGAYAGYIAFHKTPIFASDCSTISESNTYSIEFLYYSLLLKQKQIYAAQTGGAQPHIQPKELGPILIKIPEDLNEQNAIATVLSDIDLEISKLEIRRNKIQNIKKAMMQELLTGKTRLMKSEKMDA
ncbi:restriction endonuclease subunit S [Candidatus Pelagibacter sp.]|nr:restriction endonuclease subunit S [Candidatus Pelagibacter sp.]